MGIRTYKEGGTPASELLAKIADAEVRHNIVDDRLKAAREFVMTLVNFGLKVGQERDPSSVRVNPHNAETVLKAIEKASPKEEKKAS